MTEMAEFTALREQMKRNKGLLQAGGCIDSQKSHLIACLAEGYPVRLILAPDDLRAKEIYENYQIFDRNVLLYPARDFLFFQADVQSRHLTTQRVQVMKALAAPEGELTVILTMSALMSHCMPAERWVDAIRSFSVGDELDLNQEREYLGRIGYERTDQVEEPGQYASRGGILDLFPLTEDNPVRIELWGDEIDSIRSFDVQSQRCLEELQNICVYPASEFVTDDDVNRKGLEKIRKEL
jgi:transcription-repair coupling factor (superfamily II helicase)